jgi:very-short-patch-repair endonuclease
MMQAMARLPKLDRTLTIARRLRRDLTEPERLLWMLLRDRRFAQYKFRRQVPIGPYIADFVCFSAKLVLELDGVQHLEARQAAHDLQRTAHLEQAGFRVLRIWNGHLFTERESVLEAIWQALH